MLQSSIIRTLIVFLTVASSVMATQITAFNSVSVTPESTSGYGLFNVTANFTIPSTALPGDTFVLGLPDVYAQNKFNTNPITITIDSGETLATGVYQVASNEYLFTLTNYVFNYYEITGYVYFPMMLDVGYKEASLSGANTYVLGDNTLYFNTGSGVISTTVHLTTGDSDLYDGSGEFDYIPLWIQSAATEFAYQDRAFMLSNAVGNTYNAAIGWSFISDTCEDSNIESATFSISGSSGAFDCSNTSAFLISATDGLNSFIQPQSLTPVSAKQATITCDATSFTVTFTNLPAGSRWFIQTQSEAIPFPQVVGDVNSYTWQWTQRCSDRTRSSSKPTTSNLQIVTVPLTGAGAVVSPKGKDDDP
jgi:hypothetical protein